MKKFLLCLFIVLSAAVHAQKIKVTCVDNGNLQIPAIYSDNMVLQREKPLRIAGTANAGEKVTVGIAGQKGEAVTAPDGKWSVTLPPMKAGGPYTLSISAASGRLDYTNVLIGEV